MNLETCLAKIQTAYTNLLRAKAGTALKSRICRGLGGPGIALHRRSDFLAKRERFRDARENQVLSISNSTHNDGPVIDNAAKKALAEVDLFDCANRQIMGAPG